MHNAEDYHIHPQIRIISTLKSVLYPPSNPYNIHPQLRIAAVKIAIKQKHSRYMRTQRLT